MGNTVVKRETEDNAYAKFWEGNKVYYGRCEHGEYKPRTLLAMQQLPTLLDVTCCFRLQTLLHVAAQSLKSA